MKTWTIELSKARNGDVVADVNSGTFSDRGQIGHDGVMRWDFPERIPIRIKQAAYRMVEKAGARSNPRMPREMIEKNIEQHLHELEGYVPDGEWGSVKTILSWLDGNEMWIIANSFIGSLKRGQFYSFYIDSRVVGKPVTSLWSNGRVTKNDVNRAIKRLQEATKRTGQYHRTR